MCGKGGLVPMEFVCCRELDDEVSADLGEDVRIHQLEILNYYTYCKNAKAFWFYTLCLPWFAFLQEEITEDDIDDSFKAMFAQLAGEVGFEKISLTG